MPFLNPKLSIDVVLRFPTEPKRTKTLNIGINQYILMKKKNDISAKWEKINAFLLLASFVLFWAFGFKSIPPLVIGVVPIITGFSFLIYTFRFRKIELGRTVIETIRGYRAIAWGFLLFFVFNSFGLPIVLYELGLSQSLTNVVMWSFLAGALLSFLLTFFVGSFDKNNKKIPIDYWIQSSNFKTIDKGTMGYQDAQKLVKNFDWEKEHFNKQRLGSEKKETCPHGIGFTLNNYLFHIYSENLNKFNLTIKIPNKNKKIMELNIENIKREKILVLLKHFFDRNFEKIESSTHE